MDKKIVILGIETSCDDTCASILIDNKIITNIVNSQKIHSNYGGVYPEMASRNHLNNISITVEEAITKANINKKNISAVGYTYGPGLNGSLLVGSIFAKSFSYSLNIPSIAINHMYGHIFANFIDGPMPNFPFLCLVISGGHTQLVKVDSFNKITLLGETLDDAIGEAYDKIGKMLGLKYPGGPKIDKYASLGNNKSFKFPKANIDNYNFSFSGIKTAVLYFLRNKPKNFIEENINDLCASIQKTLIDMLMDKLILAIKNTDIKEICIGGGVACNNGIKNRLYELKENMNLNIYIPKPEYCTDNAAMIAKIAYIKYINSEFSDINIIVDPKLKY